MSQEALLARRIIGRILQGELDRDSVQNAKLKLAAELKVVKLPSNADILAHATQEERARVEPVLRIRPTRSISGVTIVTVQSSPEACPHGKCTYCPGGPEFGTAQSYTGDEPAARRAARHAFDSYGQTRGRLIDLHKTGHPTDKVDFIIQGGTFTARDESYQREFVKRALDAMNGVDSPDLASAQLANETAASRMIGLTIETKPDWAMEKDVDLSLELGCTRYELGVQTVFDDILRATHRGHTMAETVRSFQVVKDAGLKLCAHVMPGQPGSSYEKDLETFRQMFADPRFAPDMLKIYPTLVIAGTSLFRQWQLGKYEPVTEAYCVKLLAEAKAMAPPWLRIQRIDRDIPSPRIEAGVKKLNLRELVHAEMARQGTRCRCIRCREAGHVANKERRYAAVESLTRREYASAGGKEHFLALEDQGEDIILGFARYREPSPGAHRPEVQGALILRELKVFGTEVPIGEHDEREGLHQHRGLGARLVREGEALARELGKARVVVTAGVGVREYYRKLGYARLGPYMAKPVR